MLCDDRTRPPLLVPLTLLGCRVDVLEESPAHTYTGGSYLISRLLPECGGPRLHTLCLDESSFAADVMKAGGQLSFEQMKLPQLKEELAARDSTRSGLKPALQRRLHGLLVQEAIMQLDEGDAPLDEGADADGAGEDSDGGEVERKRPRLSEEHRAQLERDIFGSGSESDS